MIDFVVSADATVWPMVPQGVSNSQIQYAGDRTPGSIRRREERVRVRRGDKTRDRSDR